MYAIKDSILSYMFLTDEQKSSLESNITANELIVLKLEIDKMILELESIDLTLLDEAERSKIPVSIELLNDIKTNNSMEDIRTNYCQKYRYVMNSNTHLLYLDKRIKIISENYVTKSDLDGLKAYITDTVLPWLDYELDEYSGHDIRQRIEFTRSQYKLWLTYDMDKIHFFFTKEIS